MPAVHFYCVLCGTALQTASESAYDLVKCHCCSRHVPVPRPVNVTGDFVRYQAVFPPDVLGLSVKFQCTNCGVILRADARCEGRQVTCDDCATPTKVPYWSNAARWPLFSETGRLAGRGDTRLPARAQLPTLSAEEIDFLRGAEPGKPEAAA